jgi:hypothetical protein
MNQGKGLQMDARKPSVSQEELQRLRAVLREAAEHLLELQEHLIALRCAMSPAEHRAIDQATKTCIDRAVRR